MVTIADCFFLYGMCWRSAKERDIGRNFTAVSFIPGREMRIGQGGERKWLFLIRRKFG